MYSKDFFVKQFSALDTDSLIDKLANQALTDEAREALISLLDERGVQAGQLEGQVHTAKADRYLRTGITNECDYCGKSLFGGFHAEGQKFCGIACFHTSRLRRAAVDISDEQSLAHAKQIKAGPCPACQLPGRGPDMQKSYFISSAIFVVTTSTESSLKCAPCATRGNLWAAVHCALLGWWSPQGIFMTPFKVIENLWEISGRREHAHPSSALVDFARLDLADRLLQASGGGKWGLRA